jgi:hypothetical protein
VLKLRNQVSVDTRWGLRRFELYEGDITSLTESTDLLTVSVFPGQYVPPAGVRSVVAALRSGLGIDLGALAAEAEIDARTVFGCWISRELGTGPFHRVLCDETLGEGRNVGDVIVNIFAFLAAVEAKGIVMRSMAMPLVGAGVQQIDPETIVEPLLTHALEYLERSRSLEVIRFVEMHPERVACLNHAMDAHLGRIAVGLAADSHAALLCKEMIGLLASHSERLDARHGDLRRELERILKDPETVSQQVFGASRRFCEVLVTAFGGPVAVRRGGPQLMQDIDALASRGVARWVVSYLHVLRVFGNEVVHQGERVSQQPEHLGQADLEVCITVMHRLLRLWLDEWQAP